MATPAAIVKTIAKQEWLWSYVHYDGYLQHTGNILCNHYKLEDEVDALLKLGDLSYLGKTRETTKSYYYDMFDINPRNLAKNTWYFRTFSKFKFIYLYENGEWFHILNFGGVRPLKKELFA